MDKGVVGVLVVVAILARIERNHLVRILHVVSIKILIYS